MQLLPLSALSVGYFFSVWSVRYSPPESEYGENILRTFCATGDLSKAIRLNKPQQIVNFLAPDWLIKINPIFN